MEAHEEFLRSLKEMGNLVNRLITEFNIEDYDRQRIGMGRPVLQRITEGKLNSPLDTIIYGDLVRLFELKQPGFKASPSSMALKIAWERTQKEYLKNGGSSKKHSPASGNGGSKGNDKKGGFTQKRSLSWVFAILLLKLLKVKLIDRGKFQNETGLGRGFLEQIAKGEWNFPHGDESVGIISDYITPFLSEEESVLLHDAIKKRTIFLTSKQIKMLEASLSEEEIEQRRKKALPDPTPEPQSKPQLFFPLSAFQPDMTTVAKDWIGKNYPYFMFVYYMIAGSLMSCPKRQSSGAILLLSAPEGSHGEEEPFGQMLKRYRLAKGLSQGNLAKMAGCSDSVISAAEKGKNTPLEDFVRGMARALGLRKNEKAAFFKAAGIE